MGELTGSWCLFPALCCSTFAIVELLAVPINTNTIELLLDEFSPLQADRGVLLTAVCFSAEVGSRFATSMFHEW